MGLGIAFFGFGLVLPKASQALTFDEIVANQTQAQPAAESQVLGTATHFPDLNSDGILNSFDFLLLLSHRGEKHVTADLNDDGEVDDLDLSLLKGRWFAKK